MAKPTTLPEWQKLQDQFRQIKDTKICTLFAADSARVEEWTLHNGGLTVDFSHTHLTPEILDSLIALASTQKVEEWREKMFEGGKINNTENRAVLHTALRAQGDAPILVDGVNVLPEIRALHDRMKVFVASVRDGAWLGTTGKKITDIVNIGIGGSDLGPRLVVSALQKQANGPRVHFVANVDAFDLKNTLVGLNPETTLFLVVSKTFTTQETLLNATSARKWLVVALGDAAVARHFVAVSTNKAAVEAFGISSDNMFPMWDWVGGRYSLWSSVGMGIALSIGWDGFADLLAGAAAMDNHFRIAPHEKNMPVLAALVGVWYRNFWGSSALAVLPYSERLRDLPRYLQQLDMESNGKSVTREGETVDYQTGPVVFGECGSVGQHSFHQWLHQGTGLVLSDFIGITSDDCGESEHHSILMAHFRAQIEALAFGRVDKELARTNPGNKPSMVVTMNALTPFTLGQLLAFYEHKVFVQGIIWGLNSFDQFGVELGKKLASEILARKDG